MRQIAENIDLNRRKQQAEAIDDLLNKTKRGRLVADADTNSLIYIGDAETLELVRKVLQWLDVPEKEQSELPPENPKQQRPAEDKHQP